jgi:two-component system, LytTR family, response regulator
MQKMPEKTRTLIVDDERLSRKRIRDLLADEADFELIGECANGIEAIETVRRERPDLLFLDIQMPQMDGFQVLDSILDVHVPAVIFVTAYDEYAVRAFEVHALDYLLKPFDRERFQGALLRARSQVSRVHEGGLNERLVALLEGLSARRRPMDRLAIKTGGHVVFVRTQTIDWVEAADNYVCLHCGAETYAMRETMNALEAKLDTGRFIRIHRSTIVNMDRIKELQPWFRGDYLVVLHDGTQLTLSRNYRERLKDTLLKAL